MKHDEVWIDPIVDEVRKAREAHAKKFDFDLKAIVHDLRKHEQNGGREVVSFSPRPLEREQGAA